MIGWLADDPGYLGGAEHTQAEFLAGAPTKVVLVPAEDLSALEDCDTAVIHNCAGYPPETAEALVGKRVIRYHHDLSRAEHPVFRKWLEQNATHIFTSPFHQELYGLDGVWPNIPPALDLQRLRPNRQIRRNGSRSGACTIAQWRAPGKGAQLVAEWAAENGPLVVYGDGDFTPHGENLDPQGPLDPTAVPQTLWGYETFVFLPFEPEPFCRTVVEAWVAGCRIVTNDLIGARHYVESDPDALETAAEDFWKVVLGG